MRFRYTIVIIGVLCIAIILCNYSKNQKPKTTATDVIEEIILTTNEQNIFPSGLTLNIQNTLTDTIYLEPWFRLEMLSDNSWVPVAPLSGATWSQDDWRMSIFPNTQEEINYTWDWYYGKLSPGEYRIIVSILRDTINKETIPYKLASIFSIQ